MTRAGTPDAARDVKPTMWSSLVADPKHGPLPAALLGLTLVTGVVDAVSILALGRVFVANMTGNVVFVGFALAGAPGFSLAASLSALAGFTVGALTGGQLNKTYGENRPRLIKTALAAEVVLVGIGLGLSAANATSGSAGRDATAAVLAVALGIQNAVVRQLKVPDLTTTVLTLTLTGIAADFGKADRHVTVRRILAVATMLGGAVVGALIVLHVGRAWALAVAEGVLVASLSGILVNRKTWD